MGIGIMSILDLEDSSLEHDHIKTTSDKSRDELFHIINSTQSTISNETLKQLIADCLWSDQDFWQYIEANNINLGNEELIVAVQSWASSIHTLPEQQLLLKIAEQFGPCCHAQCWSAFCPSAVLRSSLKIQNLTFEDKISLLDTAIQSLSISRSRRLKILEKLLMRLLLENTATNLQKVFEILQTTKGSDLWDSKSGQIALSNENRDIFLETYRNKFKDKIESM